MNNIKNNSSPGNKIALPVITSDSSCGCAALEETPHRPPGTNQSFVVGLIKTPAGDVPQVAAQLHKTDHWGTIKARFGVSRMDYMIDSGLYALGNPDKNSPVLVTANYKMSFDYLRRELSGRNFWILVLDTKGINVWCAAGKGTFGTEELIKRIASSGLKEIVIHRQLILPQLGAPGIAAHTVRKISGFKVCYGPIRAKDLTAYLDSGMKITPEMRIMTFPLEDRAVLIPIELIAAAKPSLIIATVLFILSGIGGHQGFWANTVNHGLFAIIALSGAVIGGAVLNPLLLPYLPGRAFSVKGFSIGFIIALLLLYIWGINLQTLAGRTESLAWLLIIPAISGYLAMNFTGCSTYTSLSGVKREMRWALPVQLAASIIGLVIWITSLLIE
jgi:hypothetical protein